VLQAVGVTKGWSILVCDFVLTYCKARAQVGKSAIKIAVQGHMGLQV